MQCRGVPVWPLADLVTKTREHTILRRGRCSSPSELNTGEQPEDLGATTPCLTGDAGLTLRHSYYYG